MEEKQNVQLGSPPEVVDMTLHYDDGSRETMKKGLFTYITPEGHVTAQFLNLSVEEFVQIMCALEGAVRDLIAEAKQPEENPE